MQAQKLSRAQLINFYRGLRPHLSERLQTSFDAILEKVEADGSAPLNVLWLALYPHLDDKLRSNQFNKLIKEFEQQASDAAKTFTISISSGRGAAQKQVQFFGELPDLPAHTDGLKMIVSAQHATPVGLLPRLVLMTYNDNERNAVLNAFGKAGELTGPVGKSFYTPLQNIGGWDVLNVHSQQGNYAALMSVNDVIHDIKPRAIISVGIAVGVRPLKQIIGDVLIGEFVVPYERVKVEADGTFNPRGARPAATPSLVNALRQLHLQKSTDIAWPNLHFGGFLSGEKLHNHAALIQGLLEVFNQGDIIGGDMESLAIALACYENDMHHITVKAISDFAGKKETETKERDQQTAAENAATVVKALLASGFYAPTLGELSQSNARKKPSNIEAVLEGHTQGERFARGQSSVRVTLQAVERANAADERASKDFSIALDKMREWAKK